MKYLSNYMETAQSNAFKLYGAFFAFGNKQYEEKAIPEIKYVSMGYGLICPYIWADSLSRELDNIYTNAIILDVEENGAEKIIEREYFNHETQLTGDKSGLMGAISGHMEKFPDKFTHSLINQICKNCFQKAVENDWF
jgi:hypothetical protein